MRVLRKEKDAPFPCAAEHEISVRTKPSYAGVKGREAFRSGRDDKANLHGGEARARERDARSGSTIPVFLPSIEIGGGGVGGGGRRAEGIRIPYARAVIKP